MSFYNKKQDVIDIQLTQYGKVALSQGRFRPHSYGFFDDDIIYDISYIGASEEQNDTEERILTFARKKPALSIYGSETKINETSLSGGQKDGIKQINANDVDSRMLLKNKLLTYPIASQHIPKFTISIDSNSARIDTESLSRTTSSYMNTSTEQVKMTIEVKSVPNADGTTRLVSEPILITLHEELEFCKDEEYEIRMYEVTKTPDLYDETRLVENITNLYYNSSDAQHPKVNDRFVISLDDNIENQEAISKSRENCNSSLRLSIKPKEAAQTVMRNLYEDLESQIHDCEE